MTLRPITSAAAQAGSTAVAALSLLLGAAVTTAFATPAIAADHGSASASCPDLHQQLQQSLRPVVQDLALAGRVGVRVQLQGDRVVAVHTDGGPSAYHRAVRRAVRAVGCAAPAGRSATLQLDLVFDPQGGPAEPRRMARAELAN